MPKFQYTITEEITQTTAREGFVRLYTAADPESSEWLLEFGVNAELAKKKNPHGDGSMWAANHYWGAVNHGKFTHDGNFNLHAFSVPEDLVWSFVRAETAELYVDAGFIEFMEGAHESLNQNIVDLEVKITRKKSC